MSTLSIGSLNQLGDAFENAGFTADDVTKLKQFKDLVKIKDVLYGKASIAYPEHVHVIDTDVAPFIPDGFSLESHIGHGLWKYDFSLIELFLSKEQKKSYQVGNELYKAIKAVKALKDKIALNANVLDYLLAHQELIPESWKGKLIFFWGTIYRDSFGALCVRYLGWNGSSWSWGYNWLDDNFDSDNPAALAS